MNIEWARKILETAEVFYFNSKEERDDLSEKEKAFGLEQALNLNDSWAWGCADCETVTDEEMPRVAQLYSTYGWNGILYWVFIEKRKEESIDFVEFQDVKRALQFIIGEEQIKAEMLKKYPPDEYKQFGARYHILFQKAEYKIGNDGPIIVTYKNGTLNESQKIQEEQ